MPCRAHSTSTHGEGEKGGSSEPGRAGFSATHGPNCRIGLPFSAASTERASKASHSLDPEQAAANAQTVDVHVIPTNTDIWVKEVLGR